MAGTMNLEELERVAMAATPGPWWLCENDGAICAGPDGPQASYVGPIDLDPYDTEYVVTAYPDVTLALIARIRELETALRSEHALAEAVALAADSEWEAQHAANAAVLENGVTFP